MMHVLCYALHVVNPESNALLGIDEIDCGVRCIILDIFYRKQDETVVRVGVLNSDERDEWTNVPSTVGSGSSSSPPPTGLRHPPQLLRPTMIQYFQPFQQIRLCKGIVHYSTYPPKSNKLHRYQWVQKDHIIHPISPFIIQAPHGPFEHQQRTCALPALQISSLTNPASC